MNNLNLDVYLDIVNEEKIKRGLNNFIPLYPMLRVLDNKLYVAVMLTEENDNVWEINANIKAKYWVLIDINSNSIIEFNNTLEKDFIVGNLIEKNIENKQKELSQYTVKKTLEYKNYLIEDIKNNDLPIQKKLSNILNNQVEVDGVNVNINDYLMANLENDIVEKVNELVNILVRSKYGFITFYYDNIFNKVVNEYKKNKIIDNDKIKLCCEIMNTYYDGIIGIDNFFNI